MSGRDEDGPQVDAEMAQALADAREQAAVGCAELRALADELSQQAQAHEEAARLARVRVVACRVGAASLLASATKR